MNQLQKWGGAACIVRSIGLHHWFYRLYCRGQRTTAQEKINVGGIADPLDKVAAIVANQGMLTALMLIVYVAWGASLVVLTLALHERLNGKIPPWRARHRLRPHLVGARHRQRHDLHRGHGNGGGPASDQSRTGGHRLAGDWLHLQWPGRRRRSGRRHLGAAAERGRAAERPSLPPFSLFGFIVGTAGCSVSFQHSVKSAPASSG